MNETFEIRRAGDLSVLIYKSKGQGLIHVYDLVSGWTSDFEWDLSTPINETDVIKKMLGRFV